MNNTIKQIIVLFSFSLILIPFSVFAVVDCLQDCTDTCNDFEGIWPLELPCAEDTTSCTVDCDDACIDASWTYTDVTDAVYNICTQVIIADATVTDCVDSCNSLCLGDQNCSQTGNLDSCNTACNNGCTDNSSTEADISAIVSGTCTQYAVSAGVDDSDNASFTQTEKKATNYNINVSNPLGETTDPRDIVVTVVRVVLIFLGVITLVVFIASGIMMMISGGNEENFKKARNAMVYAIIGLAIVLASYSILDFVFNRLLTATGA